MKKAATGYCVICCADGCSMKSNISEMVCAGESEKAGCTSFWTSLREMCGLPMSGLWTCDSW
ncbi:MAG: hypothetical protein GTN81_11825 [Proteobacteria bacterium]|nr:hypothetical protein [Pseudomonadota bacterium]